MHTLLAGEAVATQSKAPIWEKSTFPALVESRLCKKEKVILKHSPLQTHNGRVRRPSDLSQVANTILLIGRSSHHTAPLAMAAEGQRLLPGSIAAAQTSLSNPRLGAERRTETADCQPSQPIETAVRPGVDQQPPFARFLYLPQENPVRLSNQSGVLVAQWEKEAWFTADWLRRDVESGGAGLFLKGQCLLLLARGDYMGTK